MDGKFAHKRKKTIHTSFSFQHLKRKDPFCIETSDFQRTASMTELSAHLPQFQHGQLTENFPDNHLSNTVCNKQFYYLIAVKLG